MYIYAPNDDSIEETLKTVGLTVDEFFTKNPHLGWNFISKMISYKSCNNTGLASIETFNNSTIDCEGIVYIWNIVNIILLQCIINLMFYFHNFFKEIKALRSGSTLLGIDYTVTVLTDVPGFVEISDIVDLGNR